MLDDDVAAALRAITALADVAALKSSEKFLAFDHADILFLPQRECAHRRSGITPAVLAMTVTHLERIAAHLDFHRSAVTSARMHLRHASTFTPRFALRREKLTCGVIETRFQRWFARRFEFLGRWPKASLRARP